MEALECGCGTMEIEGVDAKGRSISGTWTRLCDACRRHLEIGRLVEGMPDDSVLMREEEGWIFDGKMTDYDVKWVRGKTPLEALKGKKDA